jgi:hypothetical protein
MTKKEEDTVEQSDINGKEDEGVREDKRTADLKMCIVMLGDKKRKTRSGKREQDGKKWKQENKKWVERIRIHF